MAKATFAALPGRAIRDQRLTDGEFRVLAAVAAFDRLSSVRGTGQGAWASHATMAALCGSNYSRFSTAIHKLMQLGYLQREPRATNRTQFTYRVIYTTEDGLPTRKDDVRATANNDSAIVCPGTPHQPEIVCRADGASPHETAENVSQYIPRRVERDSAEAVKEIHLKVRDADASRSAASEKPLFRDGAPINEHLAVFEREWKLRPGTFDGNLEGWRDRMYEASEQFADDDKMSAWARRLAEEIDGRIELRAWERGDLAN